MSPEKGFHSKPNSRDEQIDLKIRNKKTRGAKIVKKGQKSKTETNGEHAAMKDKNENSYESNGSDSENSKKQVISDEDEEMSN